jgi:hypothetical protein
VREAKLKTIRTNHPFRFRRIIKGKEGRKVERKEINKNKRKQSKRKETEGK